MGYRSDVAAVFYVAKEKDFPVIKLWLNENFPMEAFKESLRWFDRGLVFNETGVKWYDDYEEVKAFNKVVGKFIDLFCEDDSATKGAFEIMKVGEDYDDVESDCYGDYDNLLELKREIVTP